MPKVIVGMSGGVDSAVAAYLLKQQGYEVIGVTLRTWITEDGKESRCCEIDDARNVAFKLDIPFYALNCINEFEEMVTRPFMDEYVCGRTPNPCINCNRDLKWGRMINAAKTMGADFVATGHYAHIVKLDNGRYTVKTALHASKDQTYMLCMLSQEQLRATLMPLGDLSKEEVRKIAEEAGIPVANKPDSQEICFVTEGDYSDFISKHYKGELTGEGNFVDVDGNILGPHKGIIHYTVGQRKRLGIALGFPAYVKEIRADRNEVVLSSNEDLFSRKIICIENNYLSIPTPEAGTKIKCRAKVRYHHKAAGCEIEVLSDGRVLIVFDEAVRAAAPGQCAVFYDDDDQVIGGGIISEVLSDDE